MVPPCRKTIEISQLQYTVIDVLVVQVEQDIPVVAQWPFYGPDCSSDLFLPQLQYTMADVPVVQVELFSWCRR